MIAELYKDHNDRLYHLGYENGVVCQKLKTIKLIRKEMNRVYERNHAKETLEALTYLFDALLNVNDVETEVKKYDA